MFNPIKPHSNMQEQSVFATLNAVNCNEHTERKGNLTYLSWAWAWSMVKQHFPSATYTIYESPDGWNYFTDGRTCWVKTGVTIEGIEHIEYLPVMDQRNLSIPLIDVRSTDVNKAIQRSLTKACARHGLGLYIYAGEDLPEGEGADNGAQPEEPPMPRTGSVEAAQEAGQRHLKEIEQQLKEARENAPASPTKGTATDEQIAYIRENADRKTLKSAMEAFGNNLERMTAGQANKLIARIETQQKKELRQALAESENQ